MGKSGTILYITPRPWIYTEADYIYELVVSHRNVFLHENFHWRKIICWKRGTEHLHTRDICPVLHIKY